MPGSRLRYRLDEALGNPRDWFLTWSVSDDVTLNSNCGFCGQQNQRLTYEVSRGADRAWVCQRCVGRYAFGGVLDGRKLDANSVRRHLLGLAERLKQHTCREIIRKAHKDATDVALAEAAVYFDRNLQLSPKHAACLFSAVRRLEDPVDIRIFEIQTRSNIHQDEFAALDERERAAVWPALSAQQQRRLAFLGHAPARSQRPRRAREDYRKPRPPAAPDLRAASNA